MLILNGRHGNMCKENYVNVALVSPKYGALRRRLFPDIDSAAKALYACGDFKGYGLFLFEVRNGERGGTFRINQGGRNPVDEFKI